MNFFRFVLSSLVIVFFCGTGTSAFGQSSIVIDEFLVDATDLQATDGSPQNTTDSILIDSQNAERQMTAEATLNMVLDTVVTSSVWLVDASGDSGSANATQNYLAFSIDLGAHIFLQMDFLKALGQPLLIATLGNSTEGISLSENYLLPTNNSAFSVVFDVTAMTGYSPAFLNGFDSLSLSLAGGAPQFATEMTRIQFSEEAAAPPVPEPASWMLLVLGAIWLWWRRCGFALQHPTSVTPR